MPSSDGRGGEDGHDDRPPHRGQRRPDLPQPLQAVDRLAVVVVPVGGDEHDRLDLAEAVEDADGTEVGRARGERRPDRCRGQHRDDRFRSVRQPRGHAVAGDGAGVAQRGRQGGDLPAQVPARQLPSVAGLVVGDDRRLVALPPVEQVLGHVEVGVREEAAGRHVLARREHDVAGVTDHAAALPHLAPEELGPLDRPAVEMGVVRLPQVVQEPGEVGRVGTGLVGPPQRRTGHGRHRRALNGPGRARRCPGPRRSRCAGGPARHPRTIPARSRCPHRAGTSSSYRRPARAAPPPAT